MQILKVIVAEKNEKIPHDLLFNCDIVATWNNRTELQILTSRYIIEQKEHSTS